MKTNFGKNIGKGAIVMISMILITTTFAWAFPQGGGRGKGGPGEGFGMKRQHKSPCGIWRDAKMIEELGLTDKQVKEIKDADFAFREKQMELKAQLDTLHLRMEKAFAEETTNDAAVLELAGKIADLRGKLFTRKIESQLKVEKLLNADQLKKYKVLKMRKGPGRERMSGKGRHHGPMSRNMGVNCPAM